MPPPKNLSSYNLSAKRQINQARHLSYKNASYLGALELQHCCSIVAALKLEPSDDHKDTTCRLQLVLIKFQK